MPGIFPISGIRQASRPRSARQRVKNAAVACSAALAWARAAVVARSTGGVWPSGLTRNAAVPKALATMAQNATAQRDRARPLRCGTHCVLVRLRRLARPGLRRCRPSGASRKSRRRGGGQPWAAGGARRRRRGERPREPWRCMLRRAGWCRWKSRCCSGNGRAWQRAEARRVPRSPAHRPREPSPTASPSPRVASRTAAISLPRADQDRRGTRASGLPAGLGPDLASSPSRVESIVSVARRCLPVRLP